MIKKSELYGNLIDKECSLAQAVGRYIKKCRDDNLRKDIPELEKGFQALQKQLRGLKKDTENYTLLVEEFLSRFHIKSLRNNIQAYEHSYRSIYSDLSGYTMALVMCPPYDVNMPPLGMASIAASITEKSREKMVVIDLNAILYNLSSDKRFWNFDNIIENETESYVDYIIEQNKDFISQIIKNIANSKIDIVGVSFNAANTVFTSKFLQMLKRSSKRIKIIAGGPNTFVENLYLDPMAVDYRLVGEGEDTLLKTISHIRKPFLNPLPEHVYLPAKQDNPIYKRSYIDKPEKLVYPTYKEFNLNIYKKRSLPVYMSRGCINKCLFCHDWVTSGPKFRALPPMKVFQNIKHLRDAYHVNYFCFNDLLCNGDIPSLEAFCDLVIKEKMGIFWRSYAVVRPQMTSRLLDKLRKAGCIELHYGVDSGSTKVLKLMNKGYTSEMAEECIRNTFNAGIKNTINMLVGYPGEDDEDFNQTKEFIIRNKDYISILGSVNTCAILPKTTLEAIAGKIGVTKMDSSSKDYYNEWFSEGNDEEIRFRRMKELLQILKKLNIPVASKFTARKYNLE